MSSESLVFFLWLLRKFCRFFPCPCPGRAPGHGIDPLGYETDRSIAHDSIHAARMGTRITELERLALRGAMLSLFAQKLFVQVDSDTC